MAPVDFFTQLQQMLLHPDASQRQKLIREALVGVFGFPKIPKANPDDDARTYMNAIEEYSRLHSEFMASGTMPMQYREQILDFFNEAIQREKNPSFEAIVLSYVMELYRKTRPMDAKTEQMKKDFMADVISPTDIKTDYSTDIANAYGQDFERVNAEVQAEFPLITAEVLMKAIAMVEAEGTADRSREQRLKAGRPEVRGKRGDKKFTQ